MSSHLEAVLTTFDSLKPWQRLAAKFYVTGTPTHSIAAQIGGGVTTHEVAAFLTCQAGRDLISSLVVENRQLFDTMLESAGVDALLVCIKLMNFATSDAVKLNAATSILSRTRPTLKPQAANDSGKTNNLPTTSDAAAEAIALLKKEAERA